MAGAVAPERAMENFVIESCELIEDIVDRNEIVRVNRELCSASFVTREVSRARLAERYAPL